MSKTAMRSLCFVLAILAGTNLSADEGQPVEPIGQVQIWRSIDGIRTIRARLLAVSSGGITVQRMDDGATVFLPFRLLDPGSRKRAIGRTVKYEATQRIASETDARQQLRALTWERRAAKEEARRRLMIAYLQAQWRIAPYSSGRAYVRGYY